MDDFITVTVTGKSVASGAASAGTTIPLDSSGNLPRFIRVAATNPACFRMGAGTQTAVITDLQIQPGDSEILHVPQGVTNFAVIQVSAAGIVQVSPLENT